MSDKVEAKGEAKELSEKAKGVAVYLADGPARVAIRGKDERKVHPGNVKALVDAGHAVTYEEDGKKLAKLTAKGKAFARKLAAPAK